MGASVWGDELYDRRSQEQRHCERCGTPCSYTGNVTLCGRCASLMLNGQTEAPKPKGPEMVALQTFTLLCETARRFAKDPALRAEKAHLHLWENDSHIGFQLISPARPRPVIHFTLKWSDGSEDGPTKLKNKLFEALGQPEKMIAPKKSVWEWLRKPGV